MTALPRKNQFMGVFGKSCGGNAGKKPRELDIGK